MNKALLCFGFIISITCNAQTEDFPVSQIAAGVYVHRGAHEDLSEGYHGDIANIGFIIGDKGVAVVDTGGSLHTGQQLYQAIRQVTSLPILYVINTHVHPDHIFGNAAFVAEKPIYVGHEKLANAMLQREDAYLRSNKNWLGAAFNGSVMVKPTLAVHDQLTLDLGNRSLLLQAYKSAHTGSDITVLDNKTATLWTGDLLFVERTPSIDGDIKGWIAIIDELRNIPAEQVVPGHGPVVQNLRAALDHELRYLNTLLNDVRQDIAKGITMEQAMDTAASSEKDQWVLFNIINRRNVNLIYPALEWE